MLGRILHPYRRSALWRESLSPFIHWTYNNTMAPKPTAVKRLRRRAVELDFDGGTPTSDGGLLLLREVDNRLNLISRIDACIPDPRSPGKIAHPQAEILTSQIFGIAARYEDGNDHAHLRHDAAFQVAA